MNLLGAFFALILAVLASGATAQTAIPEGTVAMTTAQAHSLARQALQQGRPDVADAISSGLLQRDPTDADALMIRAILLRGTGRLDEAADAGADAWRHAGNPVLRFEAAMLVADVRARQERFSAAQFWLRRADQAAPDAARRRAAEQAFVAVRNRNPLQVSLRFSVKPSNNVNNGAETTVIEIGGLPFRLDDSGQQLGGWEASAGLSLGYRLSENRTRRTDLLGEIFFRKVWLNSEAKALAPTAKGSDFDYGTIVAGVRHQRLIWPETGPSSITGVLGQSWYGGESLARWADIQLGQTVKRGPDSALRFGLQARTEKRLDASINDSRSLGLSGEYLKGLGEGRSYSVGARVRNIWSDSATVDSLLLGVWGGWSFGRVGPVAPRLSVSAENRDYQKWATTANGREDRTLGLTLDLVWPEVSYYGFVPQATLSARRTWSNVDIYDRNELSLGLSAVSRF